MAAEQGIAVESRTIDFVPHAERYGSPLRLFTVWFSTNLTILGVALGTLGIGLGLSLSWALAAIVIGNAVGGVFMAAHSAQGPQLGVPQMIQSRAQFGVRGAAVPLVAVVVMYVLYCAANDVLMEGVISALLPIGRTGSLVLFSLVSMLVAYVGYELIHRLGALLTVVSTILFASAAALLWARHGTLPTSPAPDPHFTAGAFMLVVTQAAAWSLSYGPYVADYSRYLPADVSVSRTFWSTGLGCFAGSVAIMAFGAYLAVVEPSMAKDPGVGVAGLFGPFRHFVEILVILGVLQGNVMNVYSAYMSTVTIFGGIGGATQVGRSQKLRVMAALSAVAALISFLEAGDFQRYITDALNAMLYLLVPWSAINLADYYLVRHGRYDIEALYRCEGGYGAWRWRTLAVYGLGIAIQLPFIDLSFYHSPLARWLGMDVAWLPGLLIPGIAHVIAERGGFAPQTEGTAGEA